MATIPTTQLSTTGGLFEYLPVALFGSVMGLTGLSIAWMLAARLFEVPVAISQGIALLACATFVLLACAYSMKAVTAFDTVSAEFNHPIAGSLFGTIFISLLLLPILIAPLALTAARGIWIAGCIGMLAFAVSIVIRWTSTPQQVKHATPPWVIPVVGLLDIPLAVPSLDLSVPHELLVLSLAVGLFFAVPLFTLIFARLVFEEPIPDAMQPSLFILLAPFSVGMSTYVTTTGRTDLFAEALLSIAVFLLVVLARRFRYLGSCCPFRVAWWAVSFPLAATAIAALRVDLALHTSTTRAFAYLMLGFASVVIVYLLGRTWFGVFRGELKALST